MNEGRWTAYTRWARQSRALLSFCLIGAIGAASIAIDASPRGVVAATLSSSWPLVPLALGSAVVIAAGEIDLSVAGAVSLYGMAGLFLASLGWSPPLVVASSLLLACVVSTFNAIAVVRYGVPALIATLASGLVCAGGALLLDSVLATAATAAVAGGGEPAVTRTLPVTYQLGLFRATSTWAIAAVITATFWRFFTLAGLRHLAVGLDPEAAMAAVLPVSRIRATAIVVSGLLAWVSSMLLHIGFQGGGWNPATGRGLELTAIVIAVLGGTRITGGTLDPIAVMLAAMLWQAMGQLQYVVPGLGPETQLLFTGTIVAAIAFIQARQRGAWL